MVSKRQNPFQLHLAIPQLHAHVSQAQKKSTPAHLPALLSYSCLWNWSRWHRKADPRWQLPQLKLLAYTSLHLLQLKVPRYEDLSVSCPDSLLDRPCRNTAGLMSREMLVSSTLFLLWKSSHIQQTQEGKILILQNYDSDPCLLYRGKFHLFHTLLLSSKLNNRSISKYLLADII